MWVLVGLGANLGDRERSLRRAAVTLGARFRWRAGSRLWNTGPLGPPQNDFLNAAVLLEVADHPLEVLAFCQLLEARSGRDRSREAPRGPRTLDLDLLAAETLVVASPGLNLPHPRFHLRRFALLPAAELIPGWIHPRLHRTIDELAADPALDGQRCEPSGPPLEPADRP